eukprot:GHRQ01037656.1.p1 GENE.GHRQ01037656.1~~GHRQ01037656.1.p1  ORF type:complete len:198 (+),score=6.66 GHRQ01037656.1:354-947(+)
MQGCLLTRRRPHGLPHEVLALLLEHISKRPNSFRNYSIQHRVYVLPEAYHSNVNLVLPVHHPPHQPPPTVSATRMGINSRLPLRFCALPTPLIHFLNVSCPPATAAARSPLSCAASTAAATSRKLSSWICHTRRHVTHAAVRAAAKQGGVAAGRGWARTANVQCAGGSGLLAKAVGHTKHCMHQQVSAGGALLVHIL